MKPITMLGGVLLGSSAAITVGLAVVGIITLVLGRDAPELQREFPALVRNTLIFIGFTAIAASSFYADVKRKRWSPAALAALVAALAGLVIYYLP